MIDMSKRGANGGKARHAALTPERRTEIARSGAFQMWANKRARALKLAKRKNGKRK